MPKTATFLVIEIEGETTILNETAIAATGMDESEVRECYGDLAYWLVVTLKDCTFADQQRATREAGGDETLLPQKRFAVAVEKWTKQYAAQESMSVLAVTEDAFANLTPPALGNAIDSAILSAWYPGASKASDFFHAFRKKRAESEEATKSTSSPSTPA